MNDPNRLEVAIEDLKVVLKDLEHQRAFIDDPEQFDWTYLLSTIHLAHQVASRCAAMAEKEKGLR